MTHPLKVPALLLFDIDGTLMLSGGAGRDALHRSFKELFDVDDATAGIRLHGQTDPQIFADILKARNLDPDPTGEAFHAVRERYIRYLAQGIQDAPAELMPGIPVLLDLLSQTAGFYLSLVTGNIEEGARTKLSRFDLNRYFDTGGYGSDSAERRDLVPIAIDRVRKTTGQEFEKFRVVVIGDTEKDIDCGKFNGVKTVAVATGGTTYEHLESTQPDSLFRNFSDSDAVYQTLLTLVS